MNKNNIKIFLSIFLVLSHFTFSYADEAEENLPEEKKYSEYIIFDDKAYLDGYTQKYSKFSLETILAMIQDETISQYKTASAVRVFKNTFAKEIFSKEKRKIEKLLLKRLDRTDSAFVQVEIMHALLKIDRYKYFKSMVPALISKLDHYNDAVNESAFIALLDMTTTGSGRPREARIIFNRFRKILFLSRKRLGDVDKPGTRLVQKIKLLRWSIKILGTQELKKLPKEVINLL